MSIGYYPGCSLHSSAKEYDLSTKAVFKSLGIDLKELKDWNCCGALEASSLNPLLSLALCARNLAIAAKDYTEIVIPCPVCRVNMLRVEDEAGKHPQLKAKLEHIIGEKLQLGKVAIKHPLEIIINDIGIDKIKERVKKPLGNLKVAAYYGCLLIRPSRITQFDDPENPRSLSELITVLGAEDLNFPFKTKCCGGALLMTNEDLTFEMTKNILLSAKEIGADCIVTACNMCQMALETLCIKAGAKYNIKLDMPVIYFTELMGLAFGIKDVKGWFKKHLVSPSLIYSKVG
ncbi:MAG: CoB--CoM heterodisulfide reductase iron-sulfur subunit B family protein [Nitrospirota bacterium]